MKILKILIYFPPLVMAFLLGMLTIAGQFFNISILLWLMAAALFAAAWLLDHDKPWGIVLVLPAVLYFGFSDLNQSAEETPQWFLSFFLLGFYLICTALIYLNAKKKK